MAVEFYEDGLQEYCNSFAALEVAKFVLATDIRDGRKLQEITPKVAGREARGTDLQPLNKQTITSLCQAKETSLVHTALLKSVLILDVLKIVNLCQSFSLKAQTIYAG